jgi:hypothetical protein
MCIALATSKKGAQMEYYSKMHGYIVVMATSGHPLGDEEFVSYLLAGLDEDFYPKICTVVAHVGGVQVEGLATITQNG